MQHQALKISDSERSAQFQQPVPSERTGLARPHTHPLLLLFHSRLPASCDLCFCPWSHSAAVWSSHRNLRQTLTIQYHGSNIHFAYSTSLGSRHIPSCQRIHKFYSPTHMLHAIFGFKSSSDGFHSSSFSHIRPVLLFQKLWQQHSPPGKLAIDISESCFRTASLWSLWNEVWNSIRFYLNSQDGWSSRSGTEMHHFYDPVSKSHLLPSVLQFLNTAVFLDLTNPQFYVTMWLGG